MTVNEMCNIWNGLRPAEGFAFQLGNCRYAHYPIPRRGIVRVARLCPRSEGKAFQFQTIGRDEVAYYARAGNWACWQRIYDAPAAQYGLDQASAPYGAKLL